MELAELVLGSPRGRFFCAHAAYTCSTDSRAARHRRPQNISDARDVIEGVDADAVAELTELDLLDALGFAADFARYWQPPDEDDIIFAAPEVVAALRPIADAVLASPHTSWWGDAVDVHNQRWVVHPMSPAQWPESTAPYRPESSGLDEWRQKILETEIRFGQYRSTNPAADVHGEWWSTPIFSNTLTTSRSLDGVGALELMMEEDSDGGSEARVWPVRVRNSARVYEISTPSDWARLVEKYPLSVRESRRAVWYETTGEHLDWNIPDWAAVAKDYDAAHLSLMGYLTTPGIAIPLSDGRRSTLLGGWDPDATFWLDPEAIDVDDEPTLWQRVDERWEEL